MSGYWNKRLDAIPRGKSRKTANNERTAYLDVLNWLVIRYQRTNIVIVDLDEKIINVNTGGWDTVSTVTHINKALERVAREHVWAPYAFVSRAQGVMHINVLQDSIYRRHSVYRLEGTWGVHHG